MNETYRGGSISYNEETNKWDYQVEKNRGSRSSLVEARKSIDGYVDAEKKFDKHTALVTASSWDNVGSLATVAVTSYQDNDRFGQKDAWITKRLPDGKTERSKVPIRALYEDSEANRAKKLQMDELDKQIGELLIQRRAIYESLDKYQERK